MSSATNAAPAVVNSTSVGSIRVEPMTCTIGAVLGNVNLGVATRDAELVAEIRALLLSYKVLFFRDQDITRAEHVAFARHFGELEDHPVAGSDPEHPVVRTHPETGEKTLFVNAFTTHFTNYHTADRVRFGQDANPGAALLLN